MSKSVSLLLLMVLLIVARATPRAFAEEGAKRFAFPKDTLTLSTDFAFAATMGAHNASIPSLQIAGNYYVFNNFSLGAEVTALGFIQPSDDAVAIELALLLRHHLLQWDDDRFTLFADASFGPSQSSSETPENGTHFNFVTRVGLGLTYRLDERMHLIFGSRYFHLSNAGIHGVDQNPSFNGIEFYCGLMWQL